MNNAASVKETCEGVRRLESEIEVVKRSVILRKDYLGKVQEKNNQIFEKNIKAEDYIKMLKAK